MKSLGMVQPTTQAVSGTKAKASDEGVSVREDQGKGSKQNSGQTTEFSTEAADISASLKARLDIENKSVEISSEFAEIVSQFNTFKRKFTDMLREILAELKEYGKDSSLSEIETLKARAYENGNFGVEQVSYKNMWSVLKTLLKEVRNIGVVHDEELSMVVNEHVETHTAFMKVDSVVEYLEKHSTESLEDKVSETSSRTVEQIASDSANSLETQSGIKPETALGLLSSAPE